jgi:hypothetical protein
MINLYLISDGSSDVMLVPILDWLLRQYVQVANPVQWVNFRDLQNPPDTLEDKIRVIISSKPVDLLFIHRDAERQSPDQRRTEIQNALGLAQKKQAQIPPVVSVIPVRMTEAWMLFDEMAIRKAAGNPNSKVQLDLPEINQLERLPDPKQVLYALLKVATERSGRRREQFKPERDVHRIAEYITDFSPLRKLFAFQALESDLQELINTQGWNNPN